MTNQNPASDDLNTHVFETTIHVVRTEEPEFTPCNCWYDRNGNCLYRCEEHFGMEDPWEDRRDYYNR